MNYTMLSNIVKIKQFYYKTNWKKINISQQQLSRYETGASLIPLDKLLMLADVLNISVSYFFDEMGCDEE